MATTVQMRTLGKTDLRVAPLCLGGNVFGWTADEKASQDVLNTYTSLGGNFIDTADVYSNWINGHKGGESESVLGRWMQQRRNRQDLVIVTKVGSQMGPGPDEKGLSRTHIMAGVEDSLRRLQTDYIDLYLAHRDDPDAPLTETLEAFTRLAEQGKVRYIGGSNYSPERLEEALKTSDQNGYARFVCFQPPFSLVNRSGYEGAIEDICKREGLGVITYSALAGGFLTGKYKPGQPVPNSPRAGNIKDKYMNKSGFAIVEALERVAKEHDATPSQVALAWQMARPSITAPIASATSADQAREIWGATQLELSPSEVEELEHAGE